MAIRCYIDGSEVAATTLGPREMNFGQPVTNRRLVDYRVTIPIGEFLATIRDEYNLAMSDFRDDIPLERGASQHLRELHKLDWPTADETLKAHPELFRQFCRESLDYDFLHAAFPRTDTKRAHYYLLNTVDVMTFEDGLASIEGQAIEMPGKR